METLPPTIASHAASITTKIISAKRATDMSHSRTAHPPLSPGNKFLNLSLFNTTIICTAKFIKGCLDYCDIRFVFGSTITRHVMGSTHVWCTLLQMRHVGCTTTDAPLQMHLWRAVACTSGKGYQIALRPQLRCAEESAGFMKSGAPTQAATHFAHTHIYIYIYI